MSRYQGDLQKRARIQRESLHPVWYGIGCLMTIITPIVSGAAARVMVDYGISQKWGYVLAMNGSIQFPNIFYQIPVISTAASYITNMPFFEGLFVFFVIFLLVFSGVFALLNAFLFRTFGPPQYSRIDAPPIRNQKGNKKFH